MIKMKNQISELEKQMEKMQTHINLLLTERENNKDRIENVTSKCPGHTNKLDKKTEEDMEKINKRIDDVKILCTGHNEQLGKLAVNMKQISSRFNKRKIIKRAIPSEKKYVNSIKNLKLHFEKRLLNLSAKINAKTPSHSTCYGDKKLNLKHTAAEADVHGLKINTDMLNDGGIIDMHVIANVHDDDHKRNDGNTPDDDPLYSEVEYLEDCEQDTEIENIEEASTFKSKYLCPPPKKVNGSYVCCNKGCIWTMKNYKNMRRHQETCKLNRKNRLR